MNDKEPKLDESKCIAHSLSVYSLVRQVIFIQKSMRKSLIVLLALLVLAIFSYYPIIPSISDVDFIVFGIKISNTSLTAFRFILIVPLFYYIFIFGTNFYKGLQLIITAETSIKKSTFLDASSKDNYDNSLSDHYLFDAIRSVIYGKKESKSQENNKDTKEEKINAIMSFIVVGIFMLAVLFAEWFVSLGLYGSTIVEDNGELSQTYFGLIINIIVAIIFAILSFLFFQKMFELAKDTSKRKKVFKVASIVLLVAQFFAFALIGSHYAKNQDKRKLLLHGCYMNQAYSNGKCEKN